jgi:hypothetical protein
MVAGPGKYSLDHILGTELPRWSILPGLAAVAAGVAAGLMGNPGPQETTQESGADTAAGTDLTRAA